MEDSISSFDDTAANKFKEMDSCTNSQFITGDRQEQQKSSPYSSTHSSMVFANLQSLKTNLKEMVGNLSEIRTFLDSEDVNNKKQTPTLIQHPSNVCDASKSDEMKLNEILSLLHHLTRTLTAYEKSPLLAEFPSFNESGTKAHQSSTECSNLGEECHPNNTFVETKSLRNEIDGIIQRKEALDEKLQSFRRASTTGDCEPELLKANRRSHSSSGTTVRSHGALDDLKMEDELLGLSEGGLSTEIDSLGETIQHLLNENRNFRSFFNTIASHDSLRKEDSVPRDSRDPTIDQKLSRPHSHCNDYNRDMIPKRLPSRQDEHPRKDTLSSSSRPQPRRREEYGQPNNRSTGESIQVSSPHISDEKSVTQPDRDKVSFLGPSPSVVNPMQSPNLKECDDPPSQKDFRMSNEFKTISFEESSHHSEPKGTKGAQHPGSGISLAKLYQVEGKVNFLMKEALTLKELLQKEKYALGSNDGDNQESMKEPEYSGRFVAVANQMKDISDDIFLNIWQPLNLKNPSCSSKTCHYQVHGLKKQNRLLQNQLALQIGLTALMVSPNSKSTDSSTKSAASSIRPDLSTANETGSKPHTDQSRLSESHKESSISNEQIGGSSRKRSRHASQQSANLSCIEKLDEKTEIPQIEQNHLKESPGNLYCLKLQKLLVEERLKGQLWFAAEKATSMRLLDVEERLRKVKQSKRELQAKYKSLRHSEAKRSLREFNNTVAQLTAKSERSYEIMLSTLGRNIGIAAEIVSSHLYFSTSGIHPSPELKDDPTFWFAAQCSRLRWLQGQLRQLCIRNWNNTAHPTEGKPPHEDRSLNASQSLTQGGSLQPVSRPFAAAGGGGRKRALSLPTCGNCPSGILFPYGSWAHLNDADDSLNPVFESSPSRRTPTMTTNLIHEFIHTDEKNLETVESEFSNSTFVGISDISVSNNC